MEKWVVADVFGSEGHPGKHICDFNDTSSLVI